MRALDSNVILRYLAQDDPEQSRIATELIETGLTGRDPGFVSVAVLLEVVWTLRRLYGVTDDDTQDIVGRLLGAEQLAFANRGPIEAALPGDPKHFADRLIHELGREAGCQSTLTFDRRFARLEGVVLLDA